MSRIFGIGIKYITAAVLIVISVSLLWNATACENRERIIKIGSQAVLSGKYRAFGEDQMVSLETAVSGLSPVGIGGFEYSIEIITRDDEGSPEKAFLVAQELVDQGAMVVIGSTFDGTTRVSIPVYEEYNIPLVSPFAQKTDTSQVGDNFFRVIINNLQKIDNISSFVQEQTGDGKLILIDNQEEYATGVVDYLEEDLAENGVNILRRYSVRVSGEELTVLADNILIDEPDHIFCAMDYNQLVRLIDRVRETGIEPVFMTGAMAMTEDIFHVAGDTDLDGLLTIVPEPPSIAMYSTDQAAIDFWHSYNETLEAMKEEMELSIDGPGDFSPYVYDSLMIAIDAMKRSNSILPQDFMQELRAASYDGITGHIEFDANGDRADPPSTVFVVRDGVWVRYN